MKRALGLLLVLSALAGCSDDPENTGAADEPEAGAIAEMPTWQVGQYWSFIDQSGVEFDVVVAADQGSTWLVLNSQFSNAMFDWNFDVSFLGDVQKSDLSGKQGSDKVQFFDWPLQHEKSWMTSWDQDQRHVVAHAMDNGKWHLAVHAGNAEQMFAEMLYDPAVGWFESLIFYDEEGIEQYVLVSTGAGEAYIGNVYRYMDVEIGAIHVNTTGPASPSATLSVDDDVSELWVTVAIDCGGQPGAVGMGIQEPQDDGSAQLTPPVFSIVDQGPTTLGNIGQCPDVAGVVVEVEESPKPGVWRADGVVPGTEQSVDFRVDLHTYETFTF